MGNPALPYVQGSLAMQDPALLQNVLAAAYLANPTFATQPQFYTFFRPERAGKRLRSWERRGAAAEIACGADLPPCEAASACESVAACFCATRFAAETAKSTAIGGIVENCRVASGRTVQRHVLYLGEINDSQKAAWCQAIEAFDEGGRQAKQTPLFPEHRAAPQPDCDVVHVRLGGLQLRQPLQWGACWLACHVWDHLRRD